MACGCRRYRFILNPIGACVQNVRLWEALLVGTIPIGDAASYADLAFQAEGLPIVVVRQWSDVTSEALERWWVELSPRLASLRPLLNVHSIHGRLLSGQTIGHALATAAAAERVATVEARMSKAVVAASAGQAYVRAAELNASSVDYYNSVTTAGGSIEVVARAALAASHRRWLEQTCGSTAGGARAVHEASGPAGAVRRRRGVAWLHDADKCSAARARAGSAEAHTARTCTPGRFRLQHARELSVAARCARVVSGFNSSRPRRVVFVGDSFARHAYVAFALALSGNYRSGALDPRKYHQTCEDGAQFSEKGAAAVTLA